MNLNTLSLQYALEVAKCGSISRAAQNLFVSQPNLSVSLKNLENTLGYKIFNRSSAGISLSEKGKLFLKSARIISAEMKNIENIPSLFLSDNSNLSIVCVYSAFILDCFMSFRSNNHSSNPRDVFKETGLNHAMQDLITKNYRIGFFYDFDCNVHKRWELAEKYFLDINLLTPNIPIMAILSKEHPLARETHVSVKSLATKPLVTYEDFEDDDWLGAMGIKNPQEVLYIFDRGGMMEIISYGDHVGIHIGKSFFNKTSENLVAIPITGIENQLNQYWMKAVGYHLSDIEESFIRYMKRSDTSK